MNKSQLKPYMDTLMGYMYYYLLEVQYLIGYHRNDA